MLILKRGSGFSKQMDEKDIKAEPGEMVACLDCLFHLASK